MGNDSIQIGQKTVHKQVKCLYSGSFFYGKGVDILIESFSHLESNFHLLLAGLIRTKNFRFDIKSEIKAHKNIALLDKWFSEIELDKLYSEYDISILPYRDTYEFGTSGVFHRSLVCNVPVVAPDVEPFRSVVQKYSCGILFRPGNPVSLAESIRACSVANRNGAFDAGMEKYRRENADWLKIADELATLR